MPAAALRRPEHTLTFRSRIDLADESMRPTRAEIDLGAIAHNLAVVRSFAAPARVLAVVKADAYGHGVVPVALRLEDEGVDGFGVALAEEGLELREAGVRAPVLVLNGVYGRAHRDVLEAGLTPVVYDLAQIQAFDRVAPDRPYRVHLKVDTGMTRLGVPLRELPRFLEGLARFPRCVLSGLMTHLSSADTDPATTAAQLELFEQARALVHAAGHTPGTLHVANTAATLAAPAARFDMVRPGGALFGIGMGMPNARELRSAMRIRSEVISVREIEAGSRVGYDGTFVAEGPTTVATVPIGYGDGLPRQLGNRGAMLVRGVRCPIIGRVSMDLTMLDVTRAPGCAIEDEVVILGAQGSDAITANEIATLSGTIAYDVLTAVSRRVPRTYRED